MRLRVVHDRGDDVNQDALALLNHGLQQANSADGTITVSQVIFLLQLECVAERISIPEFGVYRYYLLWRDYVRSK